MNKEIFKKNLFFNLLFNFKIIPTNFLYHIFKNSFRSCNYKISQKAYDEINNRYISEKYKKKIFYTEIVIYETNKLFKKEFLKINKNKCNEIEIFLTNIQKFLKLNKDTKNKSIIRNKIKQYDFESIIKEFLYCDCKSTAMDKYYQVQYFIQNQTKNYNILLNYWWFSAIGHMCYLDAFIKGVILKIIKVKKISFDVKPNQISNIYLFKYYKNILKNKNLLTSSKKNFKELNMRYWFLNKPKIAIESEQVREYIQEQWEKKKLNNNLFSDERRDFKKLISKMNIKKPIITIHIRQKGFNRNVDQSNFRNSDPEIVYRIINNLKDEYTFVILGTKNSKKIYNQKNIFDYANSSFKSPKNDILLLKNSIGHIGTTSGITHHFLTTDIPSLYINWHPFDFFLKNNKAVIVPKLLKYKNKSKSISLRDYYKIRPNFMYSGYQRLKNLGLECIDNNFDDLNIAINQFVKSLKKNNWKNYGKKYIVKKINYPQHSIPNNLNRPILKIRNKIYLDPNFVKRHKILI
tara:strand:+ start:2169 stop:3725 length:1557 start_codon:yes stop_codon:yes gene_type:complete